MRCGARRILRSGLRHWPAFRLECQLALPPGAPAAHPADTPPTHAPTRFTPHPLDRYLAALARMRAHSCYRLGHPSCTLACTRHHLHTPSPSRTTPFTHRPLHAPPPPHSAPLHCVEAQFGYLEAGKGTKVGPNAASQTTLGPTLHSSSGCKCAK